METTPREGPRIAVLISGNGSNLQALIDAVDNGSIDGQIVCVISNKSSAMGLQRAARAGIEGVVVPFAPHRAFPEPRKSYDTQLATTLSAFEPDIVVLAGFMRVLTDSFLGSFPDKVINLHPALPSAFPGLNAIERAWHAHCAGQLDMTGIMVHAVIPEIDAGPVLGTMELDMRNFGSMEALEAAIHDAEHELLVRVVGERCQILRA
jgi:phosphoribosylglycinamide formyltransferase-1